MLTKIITFSCLLAVSLAAPSADAEADPHYAALPAATVLAAAPAPVAIAPAPVTLAPNCKIEHDEIETQVCTPRVDHVCETKDVTAQHVEYEKKCIEVTSKHCAGIAAPAVAAAPVAHVVAKRDAEQKDREGKFYGFHGLHHAAIAPVAAPIAAPVAYAAHHETVTTPCHEVVSEHCLDSPIVVETVVPIEQCHAVHLVDCVPETQKIPKTICEAVEHTVVHQLAHPFAYGHGWGK
jgi:hypothetical protein